MQGAKKITKALAGIKFDISKIKSDINEINIKLNIIGEKSGKSAFSLSKFNFPLTTELEVDELEDRIKDTVSEDFQDLVTDPPGLVNYSKIIIFFSF